MASNDTTKKTIVVALLLCVVCSVVVSTAAVMLRPAQIANKEKDFKQNILRAADMFQQDVSIEKQFEKIETRLVDLSNGTFFDGIDVEEYDQQKASKTTKLSSPLSKEEDLATIGRLEQYAKVYLVKGESGLEKIILPIRGYGLWSTLRGFIALESDLNTVIGIGYYDHKETPGLGGEVDNPSWKSIWAGKKIYNEQGQVALDVIKGSVTSTTPAAEYKVDGLSGATLTSKGVDNMIDFWFGEQGYASFLSKLKKGEA